MVEPINDANEMVDTIRKIALFVGMGDGHVSEEELEYLDQEAPGWIRHCLASRSALQALMEGQDIEEVLALIPDTIRHEVSMGMIFGGTPTWASEALEERAASGDIAAYELQFANRINDPIDQMITHYFARRILHFSGQPHEGELKAYVIMLAGWMGTEVNEETIESLTQSANTILPMLFGLAPADDGDRDEEADD